MLSHKSTQLISIFCLYKKKLYHYPNRHALRHGLHHEILLKPISLPTNRKCPHLLKISKILKLYIILSSVQKSIGPNSISKIPKAKMNRQQWPESVEKQFAANRKEESSKSRNKFP